MDAINVVYTSQLVLLWYLLRRRAAISWPKLFNPQMTAPPQGVAEQYQLCMSLAEEPGKNCLLEAYLSKGI